MRRVRRHTTTIDEDRAAAPTRGPDRERPGPVETLDGRGAAAADRVLAAVTSAEGTGSTARREPGGPPGAALEAPTTPGSGTATDSRTDGETGSETDSQTDNETDDGPAATDAGARTEIQVRSSEPLTHSYLADQILAADGRVKQAQKAAGGGDATTAPTGALVIQLKGNGTKVDRESFRDGDSHSRKAFSLYQQGGRDLAALCDFQITQAFRKGRPKRVSEVMVYARGSLVGHWSRGAGDGRGSITRIAP